MIYIPGKLAIQRVYKLSIAMWAYQRVDIKADIQDIKRNSDGHKPQETELGVITQSTRFMDQICATHQ